MIHNLGKILLIILSLHFSLLGKVILKAPLSFTQGDFVEFQIVASGENIELPKIEKIEEYSVQALGRSVQTQIINGDRSQSIVQTYAFKPLKDVTIPAFEVKVNGKIESTQEKKLIMAKAEKTVSSLYDFEIKVDNTKPYVGEKVLLNVLFKYRKDINIVDLEFQKPTFGGFWVKQLKEPVEVKDQDPRYHYQSLQFLLFPQKSGKLELGPFKIGVVTLDGSSSNRFFLSGATNKQVVYSNSLTLDVEKTPSNVRLIGEFELETTVDKTKVQAGEAISYKIKIKGHGNMDDLPEFNLDVPTTTIYENPPKKEYLYKDGKYQGEYTKVFSIVPSQSFTLPSISLKYLDKEEQKVKTLQSKKYDIVVEGVKKENTKLETLSEKETISKETKVQQSQNQTPLSLFEKISYFLFGAGFIIVLLVLWKFFQTYKRTKQKEEVIPLYKRIKKAKTTKDLLGMIAIYINIDKDLDKIIYQIEQSDDVQNFTELKKQLIKVMKNKNIKGNS